MVGAQTSQGSGHPYVPRELNLPGFVPGILSMSTILGVYGGSSLLVVSLIWILSVENWNPHELVSWGLSYVQLYATNMVVIDETYSLIGRVAKILKLDRVLMCWWVFTGLTHMILEGYFVFSPKFYQEKSPQYLAEVWKEYSKGDSRYAARDAAVVAVEGLTVVLEGPACLLAAYAIGTRKSYSHILQIAISLGQLYGTAVYYITSYLDGDNFATNSFYYYAYYIFANSFWVWIPTLIVIRCWNKICAAFNAQEQKISTKKH